MRQRFPRNSDVEFLGHSTSASLWLKCRLVGVGEVSPTGHRLLDSFLRLPTDVLGQMSSKFTWENKEQTAG